MTTALQGQPTTLTAQFFQYGGGPAVDVTGLTIQIKDPASVVEVATTSTGITHPGLGVYQYIWSVPAAAPLGDHLVSWAATYNGPVTATELITVQSASSATWCLVQDVPLITGVTVTQAQLLQAGFNIDVAAARSYAVDGMRVGARDLNWLKLATAYQAAWLSTQVDAFNRIDALDISQGRSRTQLRDTAMFLAPHARKALKRVSWLKARSLHIRSPFTDGMGAIGLDPLSSAADWIGPWSAI